MRSASCVSGLVGSRRAPTGGRNARRARCPAHSRRSSRLRLGWRFGVSRRGQSSGWSRARTWLAAMMPTLVELHLLHLSRWIRVQNGVSEGTPFAMMSLAGSVRGTDA